ncbi:MAG: type II toxin-antitoxin system RelE/ParE family toxin [Aeromicrobium sp.]|uniref:type II toxin-antitoxin system RelE family toxin n=1 Tax=Aeromicrobium sp. TaxID=1871063 RepID=UPI0039E4586D
MAYGIVIARKAAKALRLIDARQRAKIEEKIDALAVEPRPVGVKKLTGLDAYRLRVGNYRVVYAIDDTVRIVEVTHVGTRQSIYKEV